METKPPKTRRLEPTRWSIFVLLVTFGLTLLGVCCCSADTPPPDLLKIATKLVQQPVTGTFNVDHPWVSDHQLLHNPGDSLWLYDTNTKTDTKLQKLSHEMFSSYGFLMVEASPAGNSIAWNRSSPSSVWQTADLGGSDLKQWPAPLLNDVTWCADGLHWVRIDTSLTKDDALRLLRFVVYQAADPSGKRAVYDVPTDLRGLEILATPTPATVIARLPDKEVKVGPTKEHHLPDGSVQFTWESMTIHPPAQIISTWDLSTGKRTGEWTIKLPGTAVEAAVSSDGKRLAWLVSQDLPPLTLIPTQYEAESLWVSNLDGSAVHEIGSITQPTSGIFNVLWVPGDKAISFHSNGWIYEVPAP